MKIDIKKLAATLFLTGSVAAVNASVCNIVPGSVTCGKGTVDSLSGNGMVTVNADRLYKLINLPTPGRHILKLEFEDNNTEVFAFTFG